MLCCVLPNGWTVASTTVTMKQTITVGRRPWLESQDVVEIR